MKTVNKAKFKKENKSLNTNNHHSLLKLSMQVERTFVKFAIMFLPNTRVQNVS